MAIEKTETLNLRVSAQFKRMLRQAAEAEHRSQTNLLEKLVHDHCAAIGLVPAGAMALPPTVQAARLEA